MKKYFILFIFFIICLDFHSYLDCLKYNEFNSQNNSEEFEYIGVELQSEDDTIRKNYVEFELFGRGHNYSVGIGRYFDINNKWQISPSLTYSYRFIGCGHPNIMPLGFDIFYGNKIKGNLGGGISLLFYKNGTTDSREDYLLGDDGVYIPRGCSDYISKFGLEYFFRGGFSYSFNPKWEFGLNGYVLNSFSYSSLEDYIIRFYFGLNLKFKL